MDYRLNNESIVACIVSQIVYKSTNAKNDIARIALLTSLFFNDKSRNSLYKYAEINDEEADNLLRSYIDFTLFLVYKQMLPVVLNSVVLLLQGNILKKNNDDNLIITMKGVDFCTGMDESSLGSRYSQILWQMDRVLDMCNQYTTIDLYNQFKIII